MGDPGYISMCGPIRDARAGYLAQGTHSLDVVGIMCYPIGMTRYHSDLLMAAFSGDVRETQAALAAGADVHSDQDVALRRAAARGHADVVRVLLAAGASVHAYWDMALRRAAEAGHIEVVQHLLAAGADVHACDDAALCQAASQGDVGMIHCLLAAGAAVHAQQDDALRWAAIAGRVDAAQALLIAGADPLAAWMASDPFDRDPIAVTLEACAGTMSPAQRHALAGQARQFIGLRALGRSARQRSALCR